MVVKGQMYAHVYEPLITKDTYDRYLLSRSVILLHLVASGR